MLGAGRDNVRRLQGIDRDTRVGTAYHANRVTRDITQYRHLVCASGCVNRQTTDIRQVKAGVEPVLGDRTGVGYAPTGANAGTVTEDGLNTSFNLTNVGGLTIDAAAGTDQVTVLGNVSGNTIGVVRGANTSVTVDALQSADIVTASTEHLLISAGLGVDNIALSGTGGPELTIDGGGNGLGGFGLNGDALSITNTNLGTTTVFTGSTPDSGDIETPDTANNTSFNGIEFLFLNSADPTDDLTVRGPWGGISNIKLTSGMPGNLVTVNDQAPIFFNDFDDVQLVTLLGDNTVTVDATSLNGVTTVDVFGGLGQDSVEVLGSSGADAIGFTPINSTDATVTITGEATTNITGSESVTIDGVDGNDTLTINTPAGVISTTLTPGSTIDSGDVQVASLIPVSFDNLGATGSLVINDADAVADDTLIYQGTGSDDDFDVSAAGIVSLNSQITVDVAGDVATLTLDGRDGDDTFNVATGHGIAAVNLVGGGPSASDVANLTGDGSAVAANLSDPSSVTGGGLGTVNLPGIETVNLDAATGNVTTNGTAGDDAISYAPTGANAGTVTEDGLNTSFNLTNVGGLTIDGVAGDDTLAVQGTADADTFTVSDSAVTHGSLQGVNTIANVDGLTVAGNEGSDTFDVTPGTLPIFIDGNDPIGGTPGDTLNINSGAAAVTSNIGPENDEGSFDVAGSETVSYDHVESLSVTGSGGGSVTVSATNGDDDITVIGTGVDDFTVSVNDSPAIQYTDFTSLTIDALSGDDDIDVDVNILAITTLEVNGDMPMASGGDLLSVSGTSANFSPTSDDAGSIVVDAQTITIATIEQVFFDGETGDGTVTLTSPAGVNTISYAPGATIDAGSLQTDSLLPLNFENLGSGGAVSVADTSGTAVDTLVVNGTGGDDSVALDASGDILLNSQLTISAPGANALALDGLGGDDSINIASSALFVGGVTVNGGDNGDGSDDLTVSGTAGDDTIVVALATSSVTGVVGGPISVNGIENLTANGGGAAAGDDLDVTGFGAVSGLERLEINANSLAGDTLDVTGTAGNDTIHFNATDANSGTITRSGTDTTISYAGLDAAAALTVQGGTAGFDILHVLGTEGDDAVTMPTASSVTRDGTVTIGAGIDRLDITGAGGADTVTLGALTIPAQVDGGAGADIVDASAVAAVGVTISGGTGNDVLIGGDQDDQIAGGTGHDFIQGNTGDDQLNGGDNSDTFLQIVGDGADAIDGGGGDDLVGIAGDASDNTLAITTVGAVASVSLDADVISNSNVEVISIGVDAGADTINVADLTDTPVRLVYLNLGTADGSVDAVTVEGTEGTDDVSITETGGLVSVTGLAAEFDIDSSVAADGDRLTVNGNAGDDVIKAVDGVENTIGITLNGGLGDDSLTADAILNGGPGNDYLEGGSGADTLNGDAGEDTMVGGGGADTFDGGTGFDTILISGTAGSDQIEVQQTAAGTLIYTVTDQTGAVIANETDTISNVEEARIAAGSGDDLIGVIPSETLIAAGTETSSLRFTVEGGASNTGDRLVVVDDGLGDTVYPSPRCGRSIRFDQRGRIGPGRLRRCRIHPGLTRRSDYRCHGQR